MRRPDQRKKVLALMAGALVISAILSEVLAPGHEQYLLAGRQTKPGEVASEEQKSSMVANTPFSALLPTLFGAREVMASLMWVRADDYFHRGEYRPIIAMVKQITTIDPHQIDVYATGAWHMAYNFMDKRLIADGVQFLEEGSKNNQSVYDLFFELGYMHYDKTKDYPKAVEAYRTSSTKGRTTGVEFAPSYVRHQLAHAMEKMGDIDMCLQQWRDNVRESEELIAAGKEKDAGASGANVQAARHNLYITQRRANERLAAWAERDGNRAEALKLREANVALADEWLKQFPGHGDVMKDRQMAQNNADRVRAGKLNPVQPSFLDLKFTVKRIAPRKIEVSGDLDVLNLSRVNLVFRDKGYEERSKDFNFKMDNCTLEWDNVSVNKGKFKHVFDLDRDPADMGREPSYVYPLKADDYELTVTYNPRAQAAFIQDRYGWNGEGLTCPPEQLVLDEKRAGKINGKTYPLRLVSKSVTLKKDDILGKGQKVLYTQ